MILNKTQRSQYNFLLLIGMILYSCKDGVLPVRHIDGVLPLRHIDGLLPARPYCRLLGPPGCAQVFPYLSPGLLDFFGGMKAANKPHASRNYTQDQLSVHTAAEN
jgi:hypothetical protein